MKNQKILRRRTLAIFAMLLLILTLFGGCVQIQDATPSAEPSPSPAAESSPLLWIVTSPEGEELHLFGSIHAAEEELYPLPKYISSVFESSDSLAVEADIIAYEEDLQGQMETSMKMMYPAGQKITDEIDAELVERAKAVLTEAEEELNLGVPISVLEGFRPTMWITALESLALQKSGLSAEYGLDTYFLQEAKARGMEILEIESIDAQMDMFTGFSPPLQAYLLESALNVELSAFGLKLLYEQWKLGSEEALSLMVIPSDTGESAEISAEYMDALITRRNITMADAAKRYMAEDKNVFFVVGIGHMLGDGGIVDLLKQDGYTVEKAA